MKPEVNVGCCGFSTGLASYAQVFPVVEVQQTFYQPPRVPTLERWRRQVPADFEFTLKAWQLITHEASSPTYRRLREKLTDRQKREAGSFRASPTVKMAWERTRQCAQVLGARVVLFQCPARFAPTQTNEAQLRDFFHGVRHSHPAEPGDGHLFAWEPRGEWDATRVRGLCEELGLIHAVDPFQQEPVTDGPGYFRLHGRTGYSYQYTDEDLRRLLAMARAHLPCYVLFNNISMLEDARRFQRLVGASSSPGHARG